MARVIYKYPIQVTGKQTITTGWEPEIIHAGEDPSGVLCLWAEITPNVRGMGSVTLHCKATGEPFSWEGRPKEHLTTVKHGGGVWHFFKDPSQP